MRNTKNSVRFYINAYNTEKGIVESLSLQQDEKKGIPIPLCDMNRRALEQWKDSAEKDKKFFYDRVSFFDAVIRASTHSKSIALQPEIIASVLRGIDNNVLSDDEKLNDAFTKGLAKALKLKPDNQIIAALVVSDEFLQNTRKTYDEAVKARVDIRNSSSIAAFCDWCAEQLHKIIPEIKDVFTQKFEANQKDLYAKPLYDAALKKLEQSESQSKAL